MILGGDFESFLSKMNRISTSTTIFQTGLIQLLHPERTPTYPWRSHTPGTPLHPQMKGIPGLKCWLRVWGMFQWWSKNHHHHHDSFTPAFPTAPIVPWKGIHSTMREMFLGCVELPGGPRCFQGWWGVLLNVFFKPSRVSWLQMCIFGKSAVWIILALLYTYSTVDGSEIPNNHLGCIYKTW